jgi:glycosyltransferase involved in cell wall biosynthesis
VRAVKISVIVPAFNEEKLITETLRQINSALSAFVRAGWASELIVCDNNSTDRTAELARAAGAIVVFEPVNQIARARNKGAEAATGDWLIFVDADSHPSAELFADVAEQIRNGRCLAGGCTVKLPGSYPIASLVTGLWNWISKVFHYMAGSFIFCEVGAFRKVGGFNNELFASEELDLSKKLKALARETGKQIVILQRHPLITSPRKMHLYSPWEHIRFLAKTVFSFGRTLNDRAECHTWYDGRR